jgi:hypothetical protein
MVFRVKRIRFMHTVEYIECRHIGNVTLPYKLDTDWKIIAEGSYPL